LTKQPSPEKGGKREGGEKKGKAVKPAPKSTGSSKLDHLSDINRKRNEKGSAGRGKKKRRKKQVEREKRKDFRGKTHPRNKSGRIGNPI